jgi:hypothetical protein
VYIKVIVDELKRYFSEDEIEEISRKTGFVKRKSKSKTYEFVKDVNVNM